jgi:hypothetical protein
VSGQDAAPPSRSRGWKWFIGARMGEVLLVLLVLSMRADRLPFEEFHRIQFFDTKDEVRRVMGDGNRWTEVRPGELWSMKEGPFMLEIKYGHSQKVVRITARRASGGPGGSGGSGED